jgi:chemotaxis protein CheX
MNPFIAAARAVFSTMLQSDLERGELSLSDEFKPQHDISAVIGLSGEASGTVIVSLDRAVAENATKILLCQDHADEQDVIDAVGELTNMIAGRAKSKLEEFSMSLSLPTVIVGRDHSIRFAKEVRPICIPFTSKWGPLSVEVGLIANAVPAS